MQAKFIAIPGQPEITRITMYGQLFFKNEWTDVPKGLAEKKLANHPHFEARYSKAEIAQDAQIKREFADLVEDQMRNAEDAQEKDEAEAAEQARLNAAADQIADAHKTNEEITSAVEYHLAEVDAPPVVLPLTEPVRTAFDYQVREEAGQVPGNVEPEEPKRGPGRPRKN